MRLRLLLCLLLLTPALADPIWTIHCVGLTETGCKQIDTYRCGSPREGGPPHVDEGFGWLADVDFEHPLQVLDASLKILETRSEARLFDRVVHRGRRLSYSGTWADGTLGAELVAEVSSKEDGKFRVELEVTLHHLTDGAPSLGRFHLSRLLAPGVPLAFQPIAESHELLSRDGFRPVRYYITVEEDG